MEDMSLNEARSVHKLDPIRCAAVKVTGADKDELSLESARICSSLVVAPASETHEG